MASIIFLGTAGGSAVVSRQLRSSGGIILQVEDLQFHIDPGPGTLNKAREYGINIQHTTAVLVSHNHIGHCNDLNAVVDAMTHGGIERRGVIIASKSVLQQQEGSYPSLTQHHQRLVERIIPVEKRHKVGIELVEIHILSAEHTDPTAVGFKFFCPTSTISYTGDTIATPHLLEELAGTDVLIMNVPYPRNKGIGLNLDTDAAIKMVSHVRPTVAIITHFGLDMLKADPLTEAREIQRVTGVQTIAARDGLLVSPESYREYAGSVKGFA